MASIVIDPQASDRIRFAAADLQRYLVLASGEFVDIDASSNPPAEGFVLAHRGDGGLGDHLEQAGVVTVADSPESHHLLRSGDAVYILGSDEAGAVYGVYCLLETAYGFGFFLGSEVIPSSPTALMPDQLDRASAPAFATRGLLPWYDFLSGPTAWNLGEYKLYVDRMVRMGLNFLGLHVYSTWNVDQSGGAEPFLSFSYRGVGHDAYLDTTFTSRWGYQPMRTSDFALGTGHVYPQDIWGADVALQAANPPSAAVLAKEMLGEAVRYAKTRGIRVCIGFEPAAVPAEILKAVPSNAKHVAAHRRDQDRQVLDQNSVAAQDILKLRLDDLLDMYPEVDAIWLWQNEDAAWANHHANSEVLPFDASYIQAAHDYLATRAPQVQVIVSGWGAVHGLLDEMHAVLPPDIAFSALNHNLGAQQTDEVYGRLDGRSRWPIPWLEDDATLWQPQYHLHRFHNDIERAHRFGADGMIGIHWRTRVIDHVAAYFAHALWNPELDPATFYRWYLERVGGDQLAESFDHIDRDHLWPGYLSDALVGGLDWNHGHSNEAGEAFNPVETANDVLDAYTAFAGALAAASRSATDPAAADRLAYHAAQAQFSVAYVASQRAAAEIDRLVSWAITDNRTLTSSELKEANEQLQAIAVAVRQAIAAIYGQLSTTGDLGVLASLSIKYVQRAVWRRIDSLREVAESPELVAVPDLGADLHPMRVFVPVPPQVIGREGTTFEIIAQAEAADAVNLVVEPLAGGKVTIVPCQRKGRGVWMGTLTASVPVRYHVEAQTPQGVVRDPVAESQFYSAIAE